MTALIDLTGQRFGRLTVLSRSANVRTPKGHTRAMWVCRCDCGTETTVRSAFLRAFTTVSCGCYGAERKVARATKPIVGYLGAHWRVRRARGRADLYCCTDCDNQAREWSYDGLDPQALRGDSRSPCLYSLDLAHYVPRCTSCHRRFDHTPQDG